MMTISAIGAPAEQASGTNVSGGQQDGRSERQIKADEFVEEKYGEILRVGEIDLSENIRQASEMGLSDFLKWKDKVITFGDWDYKNNKKLLESGLFTTEQLDEFGNFHFGVIAAAYGFSLNASVTGAGANQAFRQGGGNKLEAAVSLVSGAFSPIRATQVRREVMSGWTFGDNIGDSFHIMRGWDYFHIKTNDEFVR
ncbi:hypothetical protein CWI83_03980 [Pseudidiomarina taiwanensis]|uniref:Bacterial toxin 44 domain-containing protein n=2 Tax=Pseudidiomarina taiwanensis TaxID=337250 RepID=A0A432ZP78_9GAMM|nr:hypothetical protein CWI83_03980 [Pseudidiomarina taiwanensis]